VPKVTVSQKYEPGRGTSLSIITDQPCWSKSLEKIFVFMEKLQI